jgi:hypothetical protein
LGNQALPIDVSADLKKLAFFPALNWKEILEIYWKQISIIKKSPLTPFTKGGNLIHSISS